MPTSTQVLAPPRGGRSVASQSAAGRVSGADVDAWPSTTRLLPWSLAAFLVMLWLVPFQDILLPITVPVDARLDRFVLAGIAMLWVGAILAGGSTSPRFRPTVLDAAILIFVGAVTASMLLNMPILINVGDFALSFKKVALLAAYLTFFYIASTSLRPQEVDAFVRLMVALACVTAFGIILEYRAGVNLFYVVTSQLLPGGFMLLPETPDSVFGRPAITGPTQHGLAATTMVSLAFPFAVVGFMRSRTRSRKIVYALASAILLAAAFSTLRKTGAVMPVAALLVLFAYRPRRMLRLAPVGIALLLLIQGLSPGAMGALRAQLQPSRVTASTSTQGRTADYQAVKPEIQSHLAMGRGYGTFDSHKYRLLDNQYLVLLVEIGIIGTLAYLLVFGLVFALAHYQVRAAGASRAPPALAAAASTAAFVVCNLLFDVLSFAQVPYLFFFVAALVSVGAVRGASRPASAAAARAG